jgi:hypothetical protein
LESSKEGENLRSQDEKIADMDAAINNIMKSSASEVNINDLMGTFGGIISAKTDESKSESGSKIFTIEKGAIIQIHEMVSRTNRLLTNAVLWVPPPLVPQSIRNDKTRHEHSSSSSSSSSSPSSSRLKEKERERDGGPPSSKSSIQPLHSSFLFSSTADLRPLSNNELIYIHQHLSRVTVKRNNIKMLMVWVLDRTGFDSLILFSFFFFF